MRDLQLGQKIQADLEVQILVKQVVVACILLPRLGNLVKDPCKLIRCSRGGVGEEGVKVTKSWSRSCSSALLPFVGGGFPYENDCRTKGALVLTSLLKDLVVLSRASLNRDRNRRPR